MELFKLYTTASIVGLFSLSASISAPVQASQADVDSCKTTVNYNYEKGEVRDRDRRKYIKCLYTKVSELEHPEKLQHIWDQSVRPTLPYPYNKVCETFLIDDQGHERDDPPGHIVGREAAVYAPVSKMEKLKDGTPLDMNVWKSYVLSDDDRLPNKYRAIAIDCLELVLTADNIVRTDIDPEIQE